MGICFPETHGSIHLTAEQVQPRDNMGVCFAYAPHYFLGLKYSVFNVEHINAPGYPMERVPLLSVSLRANTDS